MAGYTRNDTSNNIATGNVINAADLDGEFDALVAAFHASTGHTHDGTAANGAPITKIGPAQDLVISTGAITPKTDNTVDLGSSSFEFKDLYIDGTANIDALVADTADINAGTIDGVTLGTNSAVTEAQIDNININENTISSTNTNGNINLVPNGTGDVILTADTIQIGDSNTDVTVTTNGTGDLIFNTNAGTNSGVIRIYDGANGNIALTPNGTGEVDISKVDIDGGAIDGTTIGGSTAAAGSFTTLTTSSTVTLNGGTANGVLYLNGSKVATSGSALVFDGTNFATTGTATATKLIPTGNVLTGNGLHLPAANSVAITTNGANAIYIDSSQNVGIGTSSPGAKLEVSGGDSLLRGGKFIIGPTAGGNGAGAIRGTLNGVLGSLIFQTENSSAVLTDVMTLDSSGNLGLGVTPSAWYSGYTALQIQNYGGSLWGRSGSADFGLTSNLYRNAAGSWITPNAGKGGMYIITGSDHLWYTTNTGTAGGAISLTQAMTLDASGNLGVGTTSPDARLTLNGASNSRINMRSGDVRYGTLFADSGVFAVSSITSIPLVFGTNDTECARITSGGEVYIAGTTDQGAYNLQVNGTGVWGAGAYVNGSDERLKDNIQTLNDGLAVVSQLRPVTFQYKPEHSKDQSVQPGFIAQELQQTMAGKDYVDGVVKSGPEYLNVAYQNLIPILTKAIQEQQALITSLTARVSTLEGTQP